MKAYQIESDDDDIRLDRWFKRHLPHVTHGYLEKSLRKGLVKLNGKKAKTSDRVKQYDVLEVNISTLPLEGVGKSAGAKQKKAIAALTSADIEMMQRLVLYKDERMIVLNKPAGLAVQGGTGQDKSIDSMLDALSFGGDRPKLVHRLDKDTSGVLVLARSAKAAAFLTRSFAQKTTQKIYWALVAGVPDPMRGRVDLPLAKAAKGKDSRTEIPLSLRERDRVREGGKRKSEQSEIYEQMQLDEEGKKAITDYRVIDKLHQTLAWMELSPVTGRTHQLRVHMAAVGCPIVGDGKYGGSAAFVQGVKLSRQMHLHARSIALPLPSGKEKTFTAPLPKHMRESWKTLGFDYKE